MCCPKEIDGLAWRASPVGSQATPYVLHVTAALLACGSVKRPMPHSELCMLGQLQWGRHACLLLDKP